jgi:hypothetical protein
MGADAAFMGSLKNGPEMEPDENVFKTVWSEYERVIVESLITSFGLDFIVGDRHGGDVDTVHNVRNVRDENGNPVFKNSTNADLYAERGEYNSDAYHKDKRYIEINRKVSESKKNGTLKDSYTGKEVARNADIDLDHVVAAKEIHDDPGRVLAGLDGTDLANNEDNLKPTDKSINRSMGQKDMEDYLAKIEADRPERQARITELKSKETLTDKERKELNKLEKLEDIDPDKMREENRKAREAYNKKIDRAYYTSSRFIKDTAKAAGKRGTQMGVRQAMGFVFTEIWFCAKAELQSLPSGSSLKEILQAVGRGVKKGFENAKLKYKELIAHFLEGLGAGVLSSLTTTICNIFFTTAKNLVKCIRQVYASVIQAGKVLLFNPDNLRLGDRIKTATVIMATGASVLVGTAVGELVRSTPVGQIPVLGEIVPAFCSTLVSGLISCSLLIFLDRSKFMNKVISKLNAIPSEVNNYAEIAAAMEALAAKLAQLDIDKFRKDTEQFQDAANRIADAEDDIQLNSILVSVYDTLGIKIPWEGEFDTFMGNKSNHLVFG